MAPPSVALRGAPPAASSINERSGGRLVRATRLALRGKVGQIQGKTMRPPVISAHRPGVAPRKSKDVKGRAQSPHPACGRFEAAHCAAHLATITAPGRCWQPRHCRSHRDLGLDRLNTTTKPATTMRMDRLDTFEADAMPTHPSVQLLLVRPQPPLPAGWPSIASAAH